MKQKNILKQSPGIILLLCLFFTQSLPTIAQTSKKKTAIRSTAKGKKSNIKKTAQNSKNKNKKIEKKELKRDSKEEVKEWEKRKTGMKPLQLRDLIEENHKLRMQNKALLEGKEFKEINNEYDLYQSSDSTVSPADLLGARMAGNNPSIISNKEAGGTGLRGAGITGKTGSDNKSIVGGPGLAGAVGLAGAAGVTAAAVVGSNGRSLSTADIAAMGAGATLGSMAMQELLALPAGSYTINKETGQVLIGGVVDERYGVDPITGIPFIKGILFKVQLGAKDEINLRDKLANEFNHQTIEQEEGDNLHKYTIGHFRNYWAADEVKKLLRTMGIENAWIVPYKDEKRVLLKEVLSTVIEQKPT